MKKQIKTLFIFLLIKLIIQIADAGGSKHRGSSVPAKGPREQSGPLTSSVPANTDTDAGGSKHRGSSVSAKGPREQSGPRSSSVPANTDICKIKFTNFEKALHPLIMHANKDEIFIPKYDSVLKDNVIILRKGDKISLSCPRTKVSICQMENCPVSCVKDALFDYNDNKFSVYSALCGGFGDRPIGTIKEEGQCGQKAKILAVGFELGYKKFIPLYHLCFDTEKKQTLYSYHTVPKTIKVDVVKAARRFFKIDEEIRRKYNIRTDYLTGYQEANQRQSIQAIDSTKTIQNKGSSMFTKGHLTPSSDFIYNIERAATFDFLNTAPQWQKFNEGSWGKLEAAVRNFANKHSKDLLVFTGTYGTLKLNNKDVKLGDVPVPAIFWKFIFDRSENMGVVALMSNDPWGQYTHLCENAKRRYDRVSFCSFSDAAKTAKVLNQLPAKNYDLSYLTL